MKFIPSLKNLKKQQKGKKLKNITKPLNFSVFSQKKTFVLKALESSRLTFIQLQAFYKACKKLLKKSGKIILKVFTQIPITKKPLEVRMGNGKGSIDCWIAKIKLGTTICEFKCNKFINVKKALTYSKIKLPFRVMLFCFSDI